MRAMRLHRLSLATIAGTLILAGCAGQPEPEPPRPVPREVPARPATPAPSAADYVARAGSIDLLVIRSSELALARSRDPRLKDFAREMLRAHTGTSGQLSFAGRRVNLLPSVTLRPEHEAMMRQLLQSPEFDRLYRLQLERAHREAVDLHAAYSARGRSPTLKPVAAAALPIEARHLQEMRSMR